MININLQDLESIINIIFVILNIVFVYLVFLLNKKNINPQISFIPLQKNYKTIVESAKKYGNKIHDPDFRNTLDINEKKIFDDYDNYYNLICGYDVLFSTKGIDFDQKGFPKESDEPQFWFLNIENKSNFPATDLIVELSLVIKQVQWDTGIDDADILNERFVPYVTLNKKIEIDYFPALYSKEFKLLSLEGDFIEADLYIKKASSKELVYIKKQIKIDTYTHSAYLLGFEDSPHHRKVIGAY